MKQRYAIDTPIGPLTLESEGTTLYALEFGADQPTQKIDNPVVQQLNEYFEGKRKQFDLDVQPKGTDFERSVWKQLILIPFGETRSYRQIAQALGNPNACRAVGRANGANPIAIVVPCHRVIGANGTLTGFGGGLPTKEFLLKLEGAMLPL